MKNSSIYASGRDCTDRNNWVTKAELCWRAWPFASFCLSDTLLNMYSPLWWIVSELTFEASLKQVLTESLYMANPISWPSLNKLVTHSSMTNLVSRVVRLELSLNGLPNSLRTHTRDLISLWIRIWRLLFLFVKRGGARCEVPWHDIKIMSAHWGEANIRMKRAISWSCRPDAPQSSLMRLFDCSSNWSFPIMENQLYGLCTTKLPFINHSTLLDICSSAAGGLSCL